MRVKYEYKGFTLIELLVVVAIISILVAILFPVFARARESARRASCQSNMKQLALGVMQYTEDYDGKLPAYSHNGSATWNRIYISLDPYVKSGQIYRCPSAPTSTLAYSHVYGTQYGFPWVNGGSWGGSTAGRWVVSAANLPATFRLDAVPNATQTCLIGETRDTRDDQYLNSGWAHTQFRTTTSAWGGLAPERHLDGANYAFVDGHVKWLSKQTVDSARMNGAAGATPANSANLPVIFYWSSTQ